MTSLFRPRAARVAFKAKKILSCWVWTLSIIKQADNAVSLLNSQIHFTQSKPSTTFAWPALYTKSFLLTKASNWFQVKIKTGLCTIKYIISCKLQSLLEHVKLTLIHQTQWSREVNSRWRKSSVILWLFWSLLFVLLFCKKQWVTYHKIFMTI